MIINLVEIAKFSPTQCYTFLASTAQSMQTKNGERLRNTNPREIGLKILIRFFFHLGRIKDKTTISK